MPFNVLITAASRRVALVEGFKRDAFPKLEIHRTANGSDSEDQAIQRGLIIHANTPNQNAAPSGRSCADV